MYEIACKKHKIRYNITILISRRECADMFKGDNVRGMDQALPGVPVDDGTSFIMALEWM